MLYYQSMFTVWLYNQNTQKSRSKTKTCYITNQTSSHVWLYNQNNELRSNK
jgi:hypothetical protein